jgi:fumarate reductase flavoprotein subunit
MNISSLAVLTSRGERDRRLEADVVVIGGGGSGLAAALTAARAGLHVVVIEKGASCGGTTGISVGSITVNRSPLQHARGIVDNPDDHFEDMGKFAGPLGLRDNLALRRIYVDGIAETFDWLLELGVVFDGPFEEPPHRVPRMHLALPNAGSYIRRLLKALNRHEIDIFTEARLGTLLTEGDRVVGALVHAADAPDGAGRQIEVRARRAVILATGDFSANRDMLRQFIHSPRVNAEAINPLSTGDGHRAALSIGANIRNGDLIWGPELRFPKGPGTKLADMMPDWPWLVKLARFSFNHSPPSFSRYILAKFLTSYLGPSPKLFEAGAAMIGTDGEGIAARDPDSLGEKGAGSQFWVIFDAETAKKFDVWPGYISTAPGIAYAYLTDYLRMRPDITWSASTIEELARGRGWDAAKVRAALADASGRTPAGPFFALGPLGSKIPFTDGGLEVSCRMEVLNGAGKPIPGLYAAGSAGQGGLILNGHGHHIGWAFLSGRIAGSSASA